MREIRTISVLVYTVMCTRFFPLAVFLFLSLSPSPCRLYSFPPISFSPSHSMYTIIQYIYTLYTEQQQTYIQLCTARVNTHPIYSTPGAQCVRLASSSRSLQQEISSWPNSLKTSNQFRSTTRNDDGRARRRNVRVGVRSGTHKWLRGRYSNKIYGVMVATKVTWNENTYMCTTVCDRKTKCGTRTTRRFPKILFVYTDNTHDRRPSIRLQTVVVEMAVDVCMECETNLSFYFILICYKSKIQMKYSAS